MWEGLNVVKAGRQMLGETNPADSRPGTVRGDFGVQVGRYLTLAYSAQFISTSSAGTSSMAPIPLRAQTEKSRCGSRPKSLYCGKLLLSSGFMNSKEIQEDICVAIT